MFRIAAAVALTLAFTGCTLYNDVSVMPLRLTPDGIERGADLPQMLRKADYLRAIAYDQSPQGRNGRRNAQDLGALGRAYLASGRFDEARAVLRAALDLDPHKDMYAEVAWDLAQVEYLTNNYDSSLEWAQIATQNGLSVKKWHLDYLQSLVNVPVYRFNGNRVERLPFKFGRPNVPRIQTRLNGHHAVEGIIDSGAVLSIVSDRLAKQVPVRSLGEFEGTFYGLLGEPIPVRFGLLEKVELDDMVIENVPVAIMPDEKMRFLVNKEERKEFHMDFLLGSNLLKEFRLELDFDRRAVTFTRLSEIDRRPAPDQNLFYHGFRPHVRGAVNRRGWFLFILDTGSEITFLNQSRLAALPVKQFGGGHTATLQGLGGSMKHGAKLEDVQVGVDEWAGTFRTIPMYSSEEHEQAVGIIGQNFLGKFNVVIDFGRMRVDLERR
jgi:Tetratricopeptide repeat/gag-polyprotein putative aspartyl protease